MKRTITDYSRDTNWVPPCWTRRRPSRRVSRLTTTRQIGVSSSCHSWVSMNLPADLDCRSLMQISSFCRTFKKDRSEMRSNSGSNKKGRSMLAHICHTIGSRPCPWFATHRSMTLKDQVLFWPNREIYRSEPDLVTLEMKVAECR